MHVKHFSKDLISIHVWRQTQTQSTIINFYEEDMNIFNPRRNDRGNTDGIFRMEFPLMQWMVAILYKVFGNHLIITRIFMFIIGLISVLGLYTLLNAIFKNKILSLFGAWTYNFSPSFYYYTINPLPDNLALCCAMWGLAFFFIWQAKKRAVYLALSSFMLGAAALCKLPFLVYYIVPAVYFLSLIAKDFRNKNVLKQTGIALGFALLPLAWYAYVIPSWNGNIIVKGMLDRRETISVLLDYYQHNLISTVPELLVGYGSMLFFLAGFFYLFKNKAYRNPNFKYLLALSLAVVAYYLFEANAIGKIHDYYLFPFYPLLFILVGYGAFQFYNSGKKFKRYITIVMLAVIPLTCYLRMKDRWSVESPGFNKDLLTFKEELRNAVPKDALVIAGNDISHFIFFYYIDKKGWGYDNDQITEESLAQMISDGAQYLYTDSETIYNNPDFAPYLGNAILEGGSIKVYRLTDLSGI